MNSIIKWIVLWLIGKYLPGYHLHKDPVKKPVNVNAEKMAGSQEGGENVDARPTVA